MADHVVGSLADFPPGSHRVVTLGKVQIGIFNVDGALHALPNVCPHQFGPLCTGTVNGTMVCNADTRWQHTWLREGEILTCPWHGIEFDLTTGVSLASPKLRVRRYPVTVEDGQVKVSL
jgi:nitrite reductase/ring-hydroxylating ferredoxin subunit